VVAQLPEVQLGGAVAVLRRQDAERLGFATSSDAVAGALMANAPLALSVWRARASMNVLVGKAECAQLMDKIAAAKKRLEGPAAAAEAGAEEAGVGAAAGAAGAEAHLQAAE
jgi:hypothetical protein